MTAPSPLELDGNQLEDEFLALPFPLPEEMKVLRVAGVANETLLRFPVKAVNTDTGRRAFVLAVPDRWSEVADLVAWPIEKPAQFWTIEHRAVVLNEPALFGLDAEVAVFRTPLEWLAADGAGIVILDEQCAWRLLSDGPALITQDLDHAHQMQQIITPPKPRARILVAEQPMRSAA